MKFNVRPGVVIFVLGFCGLVFSLIDNSGEIGSKIPLSLFFISIIIVGIVLERAPKDRIDDVFGEVERPRGFA